MSPIRPLAVWRIELLGDLRASSGPVALTQFGSRKIGALLARLALSPQRAQSREELIDLLWPEVDLATGRNRLRHALSTLRRLLQPPGAGDVLLADRSGVRLNPQAVSCDALEFERLARAGRAEEALRLYRGELLPGYYDEWVHDERQRLQVLADRLAAAAPTAMRPDGAGIAAAVDGAAVDGAASQDLPRAPGVGVTYFPSRQVLLPSYFSAFFGRSQECAALAALLGEKRLVTISGAGGSGKSRLAIEIARGLLDRFETLLFVGLAEADQPQFIAESVRQLLRLPRSELDADAQVIDFLAERDALLVLDNFEQLVAAGGAAVVERFLATLPRLRCLVTSRRVLAIDGEQEFVLQPLPIPDESAAPEDLVGNPGVALFIDRARAARPEIQVTARNAADLVRLARSLEGVPLAIELAAGRIRAMSVAEMAREIGRRRDWIARAGPRAARDPRHASLQATLEWSWRLLAPGQRRFLRELTVFRGDWSAAAAAAVSTAPDAHSHLESLVTDSLLQTRTDAWGGTRFSMLEMVAEFVSGQGDPAELAPARAAHRRYFLEEVQRDGRRDAARLALDQSNVEQALRTGLADGAHEEALDLVVGLRPFAEARGLGPRLIELTALAIEVAPAGDPRACRAHMLLAEALTVACRIEDALSHARRALDLAEPGLPNAEATYVLVRACWDRNLSAVEHRPGLERALSVAREAGAAHLQARVLNLLGNIARQDDGDLTRAEACYREAAEVARSGGLARLAAQSRYNLGLIARKHRRFDLAVRCSDDLIRDCRRRGDSTMLADALHERGLILTEMRCWKEAVSAQRECIEFCWRHRALITLLYAMWNLARPLARRGLPEEAARLLGFAAAYWERHGGPLSRQDRRYVRRVRGLAAAFIGSERADAALRAGAGLPLGAAVEQALKLPRTAGTGE